MLIPGYGPAFKGPIYQRPAPIVGKPYCKSYDSHVCLNIVDSDGNMIEGAWIYYSNEKGEMGIGVTNDKGSFNFDICGCVTHVTVYKKGYEVGYKEFILEGAKITTFLELLPPCNFWLYISDAETCSPMEDATVVYATKGVTAVAKTDYYGEVCVHANEGSTLRAVAHTQRMLPGIIELKCAFDTCGWAHLSIPHLFYHTEKLKAVLNWCGDCDLDLMVLQYQDTPESSCRTSWEKLCPPLTYYCPTTKPSNGGEMVVWNKEESKAYSYVIFVRFYNLSFYSSQARMVIYCNDGHTELITGPSTGVLESGYWVIGCIQGADLHTFFEINKVQEKEPDEKCCDHYFESKSDKKEEK